MQLNKSSVENVIDWKIKFKDCVTAKGNLKRSLTQEKKNEIFQYRIADRYKVLGEYKGVNDKVLCECILCGAQENVTPKLVVHNKTPCPSCQGKSDRKGGSLDVMQNLPSHLSIRGESTAYRGVMWFDVNTAYRDIFYVVKQRNRDLYSFVALDLKWFSDLTSAQMFALGCTYTSREAVTALYDEIPNFDSGHETWNGWVFAPRQSWNTKYAGVIKYCLEKKFKNRRYPHLLNMDERDIPCYCLTSSDLEELSQIKDIEEVLSWQL